LQPFLQVQQQPTASSLQQSVRRAQHVQWGVHSDVTVFQYYFLAIVSSLPQGSAAMGVAQDRRGVLAAWRRLRSSAHS